MISPTMLKKGIRSVRLAASDPEPVSGFTHTFYRYPARFSPQFARAAIEAFTEPCDLVLDPFTGGGTTLVEALALGRRALGIDISSLATFVTSAKISLLSGRDSEMLDHWVEKAHKNIDFSKHRVSDWASPHEYERNLHGADVWRLRDAIRLGLETIGSLSNPRQEQFARCVLMKTAQWAIDGRKTFPRVADFRQKLMCYYQEMKLGEQQLHDAARKNGAHTIHSAGRSVRCLNRSAIGLEDERALNGERPRLILTSPPYPGIHVLYHRWQVQGGKETPAPFLIANKLDGDGSSFYTMGDRKQAGLPNYFSDIQQAFSSLAKVAGPKTIVVQMVSFAEPDWQLPRYLSTMESTGFTEIHPSDVDGQMFTRVHRDVPRRKWHANYKGRTQGSTEIVLFHRLAQ